MSIGVGTDIPTTRSKVARRQLSCGAGGDVRPDENRSRTPVRGRAPCWSVGPDQPIVNGSANWLPVMFGRPRVPVVAAANFQPQLVDELVPQLEPAGPLLSMAPTVPMDADMA